MLPRVDRTILHLVSVTLVAAGALPGPLRFADGAGDTRYARTYNEGNYAHWIDLYDADGRKIDPADAAAKPYSPLKTCGRCHDYDRISHGFHFNAIQDVVKPGRPGEPWIWLDPRTGTQIPLSYRDWKGTFRPNELGITPWMFTMKFGRHLPGGGPGIRPEAAGADDAAAADGANGVAEAEEPEDKSKWNLSGDLVIDCMICHRGDNTYSSEKWWDQIEDENFAWAPTVALGLGTVDGKVSRLPDDFDPDNIPEGSRHSMPAVQYHIARKNGEGEVHFDIVRQPTNEACYYCHSQRYVGKDVPAEWNHDEDVHLRAGMTCVDCHRNGLDHHTVRGYMGEKHPTGESVASLSCQGCHMGDDASGRLGAPKPLHAGFPPVHFEKLSCTACHSGPAPGEAAVRIQTAMAHGLGLPEHYGDEDAPDMVAPVFMQRNGVLYPHRMMWPAYWGLLEDDKITPLPPEQVYGELRRILRVRRGETLRDTVGSVRLSKDDKVNLLGEERADVSEDEWTEEEMQKVIDFENAEALKQWQEKLAESLEQIGEELAAEGSVPVYVSGGKVYRLASGGNSEPESGEASSAASGDEDSDGGEDAGAMIESFEHPAANAYAWPFAHNVRGARQSIGAKGCYECHAEGTPIFAGTVTALSQAPDEAPLQTTMRDLAGYDQDLHAAWNQSFQGRDAFKYSAFAAMGVVGLVILAYAVRGVSGLLGWFLRR